MCCVVYLSAKPGIRSREQLHGSMCTVEGGSSLCDLRYSLLATCCMEEGLPRYNLEAPKLNCSPVLYITVEVPMKRRMPCMRCVYPQLGEREEEH